MAKKREEKQLQKEEKLLSSGISSKILKEALIQQREIEDEQNPNSSLKTIAEEPVREDPGEENDIDNFSGFDDSQSRYGDYEETDEEDEKLLEAFLSKRAQFHSVLLLILLLQKLNRKMQMSLQKYDLCLRWTPLLLTYTKGLASFSINIQLVKCPKHLSTFLHCPNWEDALYLTEPENWSPNAMYQATRIFASNLDVKNAERFYKFVLLPWVRGDILKNKRLHFALYQSLKKCMYKPAAFFKGILFPLCESRTCNLREAVIIGSIIQKVSIFLLHSSVALLKLAGMEYCGTTRTHSE